MSIRMTALFGVAVLAAAVAGVATSQQPPPSAVAAVQVDVPRSRADSAALAQARQDPLAARLRGVLSQDPVSAEVLKVADASPVPVLGPADPALLRTARLFTGDRHYMMVVQRGEQIIEIYGATKAFQPPTGDVSLAAPATAVGAAGARAVTAARLPSPAARAAAQAQAQGVTNIRPERTEYGVDVAFTRFGAAYNVSFICEAQGAAGCTEADAIAFAASLKLIGGGAA
jgi:hypothetical protein